MESKKTFIVLAVVFLCMLIAGSSSHWVQTVVPQAVVADTVQTGWTFVPFTTVASNPVTGWYHIGKGQMYDKTNNVLASSPSWTDCVTSISVDSTTGIYEDAPESTMPMGEYIWRLWDSASPASTDTAEKAKLIYWNGEHITKIADL